jgi:hypothetical protein
MTFYDGVDLALRRSMRRGVSPKLHFKPNTAQERTRQQERPDMPSREAELGWSMHSVGVVAIQGCEVAVALVDAAVGGSRLAFLGNLIDDAEKMSMLWTRAVFTSTSFTRVWHDFRIVVKTIIV